MNKKYLVTSALPYVNGIKHLGNLAGSLLPADVYSRFLRATGRDVLFISATDEHGTPTELAAAAAGQTPAVFSAQQHKVQKDIYDSFGISFDHFGRTSSSQNLSLTQHFAAAVYNQGYAEIRSMRQIYSIDDKRFLLDRYVNGTCPKCGYDNARGDQCENCSSVLDPEDLVNPSSAISGSKNLEFRDTKHLFLKLSALNEPVRDWVNKNEQWPGLVKSIAQKWLNEGLQDRCITRDLEWGVPVTIKGLENKVFYVWFDAPIGYISATKEWADINPTERDWKSYWYDVDDSVQYVQFMAKDNIPFHTVSFPAAQIATGEPWKKVDYLKGFNWLNYYGDKFSTSQKRGVFTSDALQILPPDYWRYYLMSRSPENADSTFTWEDFQKVINSDLVNTIGNFVNRVTKFNATKLDGRVPASAQTTAVEDQYMVTLEALASECTSHLENMSFRKASDTVRAVWALGNQYLAEVTPWSELKLNKVRAEQIINFSLNFMAVAARLSAPIIPHTSQKILAELGVADNKPNWFNDRTDFYTLEVGAPVLVKDILFRRIEDEEVQQLRNRFSGSERKVTHQSQLLPT